MTQPNPKAFYTTTFSASEGLDKFIAIAQAWAPKSSFYFSIETNITGVQFAASGTPEELSKHPDLSKFKNQIGDKKSIRCATALLRVGNDANHELNYKTDDGVIGEFTLKLQSAQQTIPQIIAALETNFKVTDYIDLVRTKSPAIDDTAVQLRERSAADLEKQLNKMADFLTGMAKREAEQREQLQEKLETTYQQRQDKLDEKNRQRVSDFNEFKSTEATKLDELRKTQESRVAEQREQLEEDRAAFNLKNEQGVRRDLLNKIQEVLADAEVHNASIDTQKKRRIIHYIVLGLLLTGFSFTGLSIWKIYFSTPPIDWHYWAVYGTSVVTLITTAIYYLKWNDRWFREHANAEFAAKRYKSDILRASWLAELAGEWKKNKEELSPLLIDAFSKNLFTDISTTDPSDHPMDEMTNLLKKATDVSFSKAGVSIKGIKENK
jgi:DNA repair exonuclease SbcCD ATPase subunit